MTDETNVTELLPCPFCGSEELMHGFDYPGWDGRETTGNVQCGNCDAFTLQDTEAEAITAWNTRLAHSLPSQADAGGSAGMRVSAKICDGDWLQHSGADCPVPLLSLVEIKHRAGSTAVAVAGTLTWEHGRFIPDAGCSAPEADIVAYRRVNVTKLNAALAALTPTSGEEMRLREALEAIKAMIGNVDHSKGHGPNAAEMRGGILNDIRDIARAALTKGAE